MAQTKGSKIDEVEAVPAVSVTVTTETPAEADKSSTPGPHDAEPNQPPVRTNRPDVPIAQSLAAGAGAHEGRELSERKGYSGDLVEVDENGVDADGRVLAEPKK